MATQAEVASHLFIGQPTVSRLKNRGVLPAPAARSGFDLEACRQAYIEHLREGAAGRDSSRPGSLEAERARLAAAQAEAVERRNAADRGELVSFAWIDGLVRDTFQRLTAFLDHLPLRLAKSDYKLRAQIERDLNEARTKLAATAKQIAERGAVAPTWDADDEEGAAE